MGGFASIVGGFAPPVGCSGGATGPLGPPGGGEEGGGSGEGEAAPGPPPPRRNSLPVLRQRARGACLNATSLPTMMGCHGAVQARAVQDIPLPPLMM